MIYSNETNLKIKNISKSKQTNSIIYDIGLEYNNLETGNYTIEAKNSNNQVISISPEIKYNKLEPHLMDNYGIYFNDVELSQQEDNPTKINNDLNLRFKFNSNTIYPIVKIEPGIHSISENLEYQTDIKYKYVLNKPVITMKCTGTIDDVQLTESKTYYISVN